jgi:adenylate cyclase
MSQEAEELRAVSELTSFVDRMVEEALRDRCTLVRAMERILPAVAGRLGARGAFVRTFSEDLTMQTFRFPKELDEPSVETFSADNEAHPDLEGVFRREGTALVARGLDVAGEWFGSAGIVFDDDKLPAQNEALVRASLEAFCEQIDNFLHSIRAAREKQRVMLALARALRNRVLAEGLADAVRILAGAVALEKLLLAVLAWDSPDAPVHVQVYAGATCTVDTMGLLEKPEHVAALQNEGRTYLFDGDPALLRRLGFENAREEVLITGVKDTTLVGKIVVVSKTGDFDTYDRDLLAGFADFICQRVVDFHKESKTLARSFRPDDVNRMLRTADYDERYLVPREAVVAMLYVDISGFTRACEQVLIDPRRIGQLVDVWGAAAVDLVWKHGGVFDKMVGDCVIGLFGPPFYEDEEPSRLVNAMRAAWEIRDMTNALPEREEFALLRPEGLAVSTGIHLAPLFVGKFGPSENFTGFSAGMNNTARLQAQAARNEILVMDEAVRRLPAGHGFELGEVKNAKVKNVAQPLEFRALLRVP